jgi:hypothetical protein
MVAVVAAGSDAEPYLPMLQGRRPNLDRVPVGTETTAVPGAPGRLSTVVVVAAAVARVLPVPLEMSIQRAAMAGLDLRTA